MSAPRITVSRLTLSEISDRVQELLALQQAAYAVEAELIGDHRIPQLTETADELIAAGLAWHVAQTGQQIVAAIAHTDSDQGISIDRLVVHPLWHRQGLGRILVLTLGPGPAFVSTGRDNEPARSLYESLGFLHAGDREAVPGLWVSEYRRP